MKNLFEADAKDNLITDYAELLYGQALIAEGQQLKDPVKFNKLISDLMLR